jgi:hypothetical protein
LIAQVDAWPEAKMSVFIGGNISAIADTSEAKIKRLVSTRIGGLDHFR